MPKVSLMRPIPYEPPPGMNLLDVKWPADHRQVVSVIGHAAFVLERAGRIAIEGFVLSAGGVMREAAAALRDVHAILRELGSRASAKARHRRMQVLTPACAKAIEVIGRLPGFIHWKRDMFADYIVLLQGLPVMIETGGLIQRVCPELTATAGNEHQPPERPKKLRHLDRP